MKRNGKVNRNYWGEFLHFYKPSDRKANISANYDSSRNKKFYLKAKKVLMALKEDNRNRKLDLTLVGYTES